MLWLNTVKKLMSLGVDPREIPPPPGVSRRDFLKALGVTAVYPWPFRLGFRESLHRPGS